MRHVITTICAITCLGSPIPAYSVSNNGYGVFAEKVWAEFCSLQEAASLYADASSGLYKSEEDDIVRKYTKDFGRARTAFEVAVVRHWPYELQDSDASYVENGVMKEPGGYRRKTRPLSDARKALLAAHNFKKEKYFKDHAERDEAVKRYLKVADDYPETVERDEALFWAALLYTQKLHGSAKRDYETATKVLQRLAGRPGPPSSYVISAEENIAGHEPVDGRRMKNRSDFYLNVEKRRNLEWLKENVLIAREDTSPREFAKSVTDLLVGMRGSQYTSGANMVADAAMSNDPLINLKWLKERHSGDSLVEKKVSEAMEAVLRKKYRITSDKLDDIILEAVDSKKQSPSVNQIKDRKEPQRKNDKIEQPKAGNSVDSAGLDEQADNRPSMLLPIAAACAGVLAGGVLIIAARRKSKPT